MGRLTVRLFGRVRVVVGAAGEVVPRSKACQAVLAVLALERSQRHSREKLASLLWADRSEEQARHSLRQAMFTLRAEVGSGGEALFHSDGADLYLDRAVDTDVGRFEELAKAQSTHALQAAASLYEGDFADGLSLGSEPFETWLAAQRERLREIACEVMSRLASRLSDADNLEEAVTIYRRLLATDPLREDAHRALMRTYQKMGRRSAAIRQYRLCAEILRRELDADPASETKRLFARIRDEEQQRTVNPPSRVSQPPASRLDLPDKPSIAVLPFENLRGVAEDDYLSDGITDSIISALGRFRWFFVIARNTSFAFKGTTANLGDIAQQLGVRYILRGTIQRYETPSTDGAQTRLRISTELIDAGPGYLVWSDRYDLELSNITLTQDEITQSVIAAVFPQFLAAEAQRAHRKDPGSLDAWDNLMRGRWHLWRFSRSENATAQKFLAKTLELDPNHAQALADLAGTHLINALYGWTNATATSLLEAHRLAKMAAAIDDQDAWTHSILGLVDVVLRQYDDGIRRLEAALEINPNFAMGFGFLGLALAFNGDTTRAIEVTHKAIRLSPRDAFMAVWYLALSAAEFVRGNYAAAAEWAKRSIHERPDLPSGHRLLAAGSALLQHEDEARAAIKEVMRLIPDQTLATAKLQLPYRDPQVIERFLEGLAKAGLPA